MLLDNYKKQSPIVGVAGLGGGINSYIFLSAGGGYVISKSLRFNLSDTAYLNRTFGSAGNRTAWTWSGWVKRSKMPNDREVLFGGFGAGNDTDWIEFGYENSKFYYTTQSVTGTSTNVFFRDPSAWQHVVVNYNGSSVKFYSNGTEAWSVSKSGNLGINGAWNHRIGRSPGNTTRYFDGFLADIHFVDGQTLAPTDFAELDDDGAWQPKKFDGTYGTNGFHLDFKDTAAIGNDAAGSNNWTSNNITTALYGLATANQGFDVVTYTGNGGTQAISSLNFQPDFVWFATINATGYVKYLFDSVRGATKYLATTGSQGDDAEGTSSSALTAFNSNGFTVGGNAQLNENGKSIVAWCWKAGGAASSNTDGSGLTNVQVSANNTYGFSIVTYTGGGSGSANSDSGDSFGHGLSSAPKFILCKRRNAVNGWPVYHASTALGALSLNTTGVLDTASYLFAKKHPTSSVVYLGNNPEINATGSTYVAYCWSEIAGFSKFGTYSGGTNGLEITTGFKPKYIIFKRTDSASNWTIVDDKRPGKSTKAETNEAEVDGPDIAFNNNSFTINTTANNPNASGGTYIYAAFATKPEPSSIDSLLDSPSQIADQTDSGAGGTVKGNYATMNPLDNGGLTLANGNLDVTMSASAWKNCRATIGMTTGKWYFEVECKASTSGQGLMPGILNAAGSITTTVGANSGGYAYNAAAGQKYNNNSGSSYGASFTNGDIIGVAYDGDNGTITFYKNGASQGVAFTSIPSGTYFPAVAMSGTMSASINFGSRAFAHAAPSGYKCLNTANLPTSTIADGSLYFDVITASGTGASKTFTMPGGFGPDFVWAKQRNGTTNHALFDVIRGATKRLVSNSTQVEDTQSNQLTAFTSDGFTYGSDIPNQSSQTGVYWAWDAGSSTVTNTEGSISAQVRANPAAGFSIIKASTDSTNTLRTVGHGLGKEPEFIISKNLEWADLWFTYSKAIQTNNKQYLALNGSVDQASSGSVIWGHTSSLMGFNGALWVPGGETDEIIFYAFTPISGYSAMGKYTGNGLNDGPFIYTGFRPSWIMVKEATEDYPWQIQDTTRSPNNDAKEILYASENWAEANSNANMDILSNGFKPRRNSAYYNKSGGTIVYLAFAENPFKSARAR